MKAIHLRNRGKHVLFFPRQKMRATNNLADLRPNILPALSKIFELIFCTNESKTTLKRIIFWQLPTDFLTVIDDRIETDEGM